MRDVFYNFVIFKNVFRDVFIFNTLLLKKLYSKLYIFIQSLLTNVQKNI